MVSVYNGCFAGFSRVFRVHGFCGAVTNLLFNAAGDRNKLGGRNAISFDFTKPEDAGFYQPIVTPTEYGD